MLRRLLTAVVLATTLAVSVSAHAAESVTIGTGYKPGVAVDAAGTAYIAWYGTESTASLQFCRLPRGATACDATAPTIAAPGTSLSRPFVTVSGSTVRIVEFRYPQTGADPAAGVWEFTSTDSGLSFDVGHLVGSIPFDEAVQGPGDTISAATNGAPEGMVFQNMPLGGGSAGTSRSVLSLDSPYNGTVGLVDAGTPLVAFSNGSSQTQFRRYGGSGSINDAANWTAAVDLGYADYPHLAGGPSGLFLLAGNDSRGIVSRRFNGTTFGPEVLISANGDDAQSHLIQDAAGRVHALFARGTAAGLQLVHAVSEDGGTWRSGVVLTQPGSVAITGPRAAVAPDHLGVAAWHSAVNSTSEIRIAPIGPDAPVDPVAALAPVDKPPAQARRNGSGAVKVTVKGTLGLAPGVDPAFGCQGPLTITIERGRKQIATRTLELGGICDYRTKLKLKASKVKRAKRLNLRLSFRGNDSLGPAAVAYKLKIKGK